MRNALRIIVPALFILAASVPAAWSRDLFIGTLEIHDGKPMLVRCDLVKNTYLLVDASGSSEVYLKQLTELGASPEKPFQANVFGDARMDDSTIFLTVDSIEDITAGSCHGF